MRYNLVSVACVQFTVDTTLAAGYRLLPGSVTGKCYWTQKVNHDVVHEIHKME